MGEPNREALLPDSGGVSWRRADQPHPRSFSDTEKEAGRDPSELKMIVRANLEVRSEPRGDQGFVFSGTRDQIKADIAAVRELGAEELHFDPSFDAPGGSVQGFLDTIELVRELAG